MDEPTSQHADERLLADLAAGREEAFARLYDQFGERLYRAALAILGGREDAQDSVQETFAALVRSRQRLAAVRDLPAYLFASLRRAAARRGAAAQRLTTNSELATCGAVAPQPADDDPRIEALRRALDLLPREQREVIALKIDAGLTFAQIASVLEINANTAASRYRYALERLRELVKE